RTSGLWFAPGPPDGARPHCPGGGAVSIRHTDRTLGRGLVMDVEPLGTDRLSGPARTGARHAQCVAASVRLIARHARSSPAAWRPQPAESPPRPAIAAIQAGVRKRTNPP